MKDPIEEINKQRVSVLFVDDTDLNVANKGKGLVNSSNSTENINNLALIINTHRGLTETLEMFLDYIRVYVAQK